MLDWESCDDTYIRAPFMEMPLHTACFLPGCIQSYIRLTENNASGSRITLEYPSKVLMEIMTYLHIIFYVERLKIFLICTTLQLSRFSRERSNSGPLSIFKCLYLGTLIVRGNELQASVFVIGFWKIRILCNLNY